LAKVIEDGKDYIAHGGGSDSADRYIEPTILNYGRDWDAFEKSEAMQEELFGPVMPIITYSDINQCVEFVRDRPKPLGLYVFTNNNAVSETMLRRTSSGGAIVNDVVVHLSNPELPFGGVGDSGMGSYHGQRSFDCFSHHKAVLRRTPMFDAPQRYPPFTEFNQQFLEFLQKPVFSAMFQKALNFDPKNIAILVLLAKIIHSTLNPRL
jgi:aldehyde dehydrogenase (NAD+)